MRRRLPPMKAREVIAILERLGGIETIQLGAITLCGILISLEQCLYRIMAIETSK